MHINSKLKIWNELKSILDENKMYYSLSRFSYQFINKKDFSFEKNFQICLWHKDFFELKKKFPALFLDNSIDKYQNTIPVFKFNNSKIIINLIIGTGIENLKKANLLNLIDEDFNIKNKRINKWKYNAFIKRNNILSIVELLNKLDYEFFVSIGENLESTFFSKNLLWGDIKKVSYKDIEFDIFNNYLK
ncbi:hypothetical protein ACJA27_03030 [Mycoplasmopsis lipophila]|uniref:hypothetical protein n=1 Tax=Mycoplasmopsis lipophila TaxID=2117 RepID=UPI003872EBCD